MAISHPSLSFARQVFDDFSQSVVGFLAHGDRTRMKTTLFDALRRTEVTLPAYTAIIAELFRDIAASVPAEEFGRAMRKPAVRPTPMHIAGAPWQSLLERERCSLLGLKGQSAADLVWTLDYAGRVLAAARGDGTMFPCARTGWHMRILDRDTVGPLIAEARKLPPEELARLRRLCASLELYSFMLHGEHRDGIFDHGPYAADRGQVVVIKDFTDLQCSFLPWSGPEARLPYRAISVVLVLDEAVAPRFNWAGTLLSDLEVYDHLQAAAILSVDGEEIRELPAEVWTDLEKGARAAQKKLYVAAAGWPAAEKIKYGYWIFANHLQAIPGFLDLGPNFAQPLLERFKSLVDEEYERLDFTAPSPVWGALRRPRPFSPLGDIA